MDALDIAKCRAVFRAVEKLAGNDFIHATPADLLHTSLCREEWATEAEVKRIADAILPRSLVHPGSYIVQGG